LNTLGDVKVKARELVGDLTGSWLTDGEVTTVANQVYEQQIQWLTGTCSPYITKLVVVPNVTAGTTNLSEFSRKTAQNPMAGLVEPRLLKAKQAGTTDNYYREMNEYDVLPDVPPGWPVGRYGGWEWRSTEVWLVPFPNAMDIQIRGDFLPPPLVKDTDILVVHPNMAHATAYAVAAVFGAQAGNTQWETSYGAAAETALGAIAAQLVRQQQKLTFRVGRLNGRGRGRR
jgi:hypothetical protein